MLFGGRAKLDFRVTGGGSDVTIFAVFETLKHRGHRLQKAAPLGGMSLTDAFCVLIELGRGQLIVFTQENQSEFRYSLELCDPDWLIPVTVS